MDDEASILSDSSIPTSNSSIPSSSESSSPSDDSRPFSETDATSRTRESHSSVGTNSNGIEDGYHLPIYDGARITYYESYMQLLQYSLCHRLTKAAFSDLLNVMENHLPTAPTLSLYKLKKYFLHLYHDIELTTQYCCATCQSPLPAQDSECTNSCKQAALEFISVSITKQLVRRLEGLLPHHY